MAGTPGATEPARMTMNLADKYQERTVTISPLAVVAILSLFLGSGGTREMSSVRELAAHQPDQHDPDRAGGGNVSGFTCLSTTNRWTVNPQLHHQSRIGIS